jgi:hypothetical protein
MLMIGCGVSVNDSSLRGMFRHGSCWLIADG